MAKRSKQSVGYSKGMASAHCGICAHYQGSGVCALVAGHIDPSMWCKLFAKRRSVPQRDGLAKYAREVGKRMR